MMKPYIKSTIAMIASSISCIISDILTKKIEMETYTLLFMRFEISFLLLISYYLYINFNHFSYNKIFFIVLNTINLTITLLTLSLSNSNILNLQLIMTLLIVKAYYKNKTRMLFSYFNYNTFLIFLYSLFLLTIYNSYNRFIINILTLAIGTIILKMIQKSKKQDLQLDFITKENFIRGMLFGIGMLFFLYGLKKLSLGIVILLNFATPIWTIILSNIFLKEEFKHRLITCLLNTFGIFLAIYSCIKTINVLAIFAILCASFCFAIIDVYNKYHLNDDSNILELLIGSSMFSSIFFPIIMKIQNIPLIIIGNSNLILAIFIGVTAILIPLFMLKASQYSDLSALQPLKYIEFPLSIISSYLFFNDMYTYHIFIGFFIITIGTSINYFKEIKDHSKI